MWMQGDIQATSFRCCMSVTEGRGTHAFVRTAAFRHEQGRMFSNLRIRHQHHSFRITNHVDLLRCSENFFILCDYNFVQCFFVNDNDLDQNCSLHINFNDFIFDDLHVVLFAEALLEVPEVDVLLSRSDLYFIGLLRQSCGKKFH